MFFPYADQAPEESHASWVRVNWLLIAANIYFFITLGSQENYEHIIRRWGFTPAHLHPETLLTSLFLHADIWHLLGNLWFLLIFGKNVEARIGPLAYLIAYLIAGMAGDISHLLFFPESEIPTIGASGAIYGVLGMYIVFFPFNRIKVLYFFVIFIGRAVIPAIWVIGIFFLMELLYSRMQTTHEMQDGVGHLAHSGGFIAGAAIAIFMTMSGMLRGRRRDILAHVFNQSDPMLDLERNPVEVLNSHNADREIFIPAGSSPASLTSPEANVDAWAYTLAENDPRYEIVWALQHQRIDQALLMWREYAFENLDGVLPVREQLQLAHALDKAGANTLARDAYERLLAYYKNQQPYTAEAQLSLAGMILQQWQENGDRSSMPLARRMLACAAQTHPNAARRELAQRWLGMTGV